MTDRISVDQAGLLLELLTAKQNRPDEAPDGALRVIDLAKTLAISNHTRVRVWLSDLIDRGLVECIHAPRKCIDNRMRPTPHYRLCDNVDKEALEEILREVRDGKV